MKGLFPNRSGLRISVSPVREPVGAVIAFAGDLSTTAAQNAVTSQGWLPCDGRSVSQQDYAELFALLGSIYTASGGKAGTFCVPDYRGQFLRGLAVNSTQDPGYGDRVAPPGGGSATLVGSTQPQMVQSHGHDYGGLAGTTTGSSGTSGAAPPATSQVTTGLLDSSGATLNGDETRPKNIYVNYLIKALRHRSRIGVDW